MRPSTLAVPAPFGFPTNIKFLAACSDWRAQAQQVYRASINSRYPLPCTHRCTGINPQVSPPIHSDLCSPTAYATREMRYGHIPGSGACLDLPVPHSMSHVCKTVPHMSISLITHRVWSVRTHVVSGPTCGVTSLESAVPLTMAKLNINFVWSAGTPQTS